MFKKTIITGFAGFNFAIAAKPLFLSNHHLLTAGAEEQRTGD